MGPFEMLQKLQMFGTPQKTLHNKCCMWQKVGEGGSKA